ncbi:MAG TPA: DegQ family serine endoprotease [Ferrovibrio sp.]|uniref:DegQ family serine endoprotease n=1 Tax=Ferrovibrio sp. TaxID=1917215 RepID=UPI002ED05E00
MVHSTARDFRDSTMLKSTFRRRLGVLAILAAVVLGLQPSGAPAQERVLPRSRSEIELSFAPLVKRVAPAVVNIYTRRTVRTLPSPLFNDPFFRRFFGDQFPGAEQQQNSLGSGVIVDPSGLIVTNNHVIRGADEITVILADRREFEATVLRADERTDLAVLRITPGNERLPFLELRDSDDLEVGDLVLAIGNPFGVGQTVTSGIVSAVARTTVGITDYRFFIQTDAAINPGNSGGALVSMDGRLVGVNTAIFSRDGGGSIGIGFAIPSNMVRTVIAGVKSGTKLVRPWFGASGETVTADIAASLGMPRPLGVIIQDVFPGSPAADAGLRRGDIITHIEGREVQDAEALRFRIATQSVGSEVRLTVWRNGQERNVNVALIAPPETPPRDVTLLRGNHPLAGATVANLSPALADELGLDITPRGVIVLEVRRGSPAQQIRIAPGDVIVRINDRELRTVSDARRAVSQAELPWRLQIRRGDRVFNLTVSG